MSGGGGRPRCKASDHAVVRYLERVLGMDIEMIRADIAAIGQLGVDHDAQVVISGAHKYIVQGGNVITVLPKSCRHYDGRGRHQVRQIHHDGADGQ